MLEVVTRRRASGSNITQRRADPPSTAPSSHQTHHSTAWNPPRPPSPVTSSSRGRRQLFEGALVGTGMMHLHRAGAETASGPASGGVCVCVCVLPGCLQTCAPFPSFSCFFLHIKSTDEKPVTHLRLSNVF